MFAYEDRIARVAPFTCPQPILPADAYWVARATDVATVAREDVHD